MIKCTQFTTFMHQINDLIILVQYAFPTKIEIQQQLKFLSFQLIHFLKQEWRGEYLFKTNDLTINIIQNHLYPLMSPSFSDSVDKFYLLSNPSYM